MGILDGWRFCPRCAAETERDADSARCVRCGFVVWANSAPAVQALVERDGRILLGRRGIEPGYGRWDLPGGFLHEGEHPLDGLRREVREETGLEIEPGRFVGFWLEPYDGRVVLSITYEATTEAGDARPADDLTELRWFAPTELPAAAELAFPSYVEILELWRQQHA
jgi:ADP-ribose pyrophosphatase YjhB (NUDIX family)